MILRMFIVAFGFLFIACLSVTLGSSEDRACNCIEDPPQKNIQPLVFCNWYNAKSCCLSAHDADINGKFLGLIEAGPACKKYQNKAKRFLSFVFCYACDPEEPTHFTTPLDTQFFTSSMKTVKICASVALKIKPKFFSDCGLLLPENRESICSSNSPIVPHKVWTGCEDQQHICQDHTTSTWYCSNSVCGAAHTPIGFNDVPCNTSRHTCDGVLMFLNDNRAAKPPNYEEYAVEIVDEQLCKKELGEEEGSMRCKCFLHACDSICSSRLIRKRSKWILLPDF
ncbi:RxLR-like protein [Plasmopara halstedii]|uniref:RxLR-like protein n=1 Tax=Plasmopara halstedii TaxID=4781 RepID=A0A0P1ACY1_PLAHL|nr:RxLR-like protein [Plasmopara halstedii]CEG38528.1 RxLR-like protein [Plasmopara halstedii]|eukprot:XP_024574897.1 RxLR-like protein [Plasmopara halstedii]